MKNEATWADYLRTSVAGQGRVYDDTLAGANAMISVAYTRVPI